MKLSYLSRIGKPDAIPKLSHVHKLTGVSKKDATCTEPGNIAYWVCECGKYFSDVQGKNEIDKDSVVISAKGHIPVTDPAVPATETNTGLTEGSHCKECGAILVKQEVTPRKESSGQVTGTLTI